VSTPSREYRNAVIRAVLESPEYRAESHEFRAVCAGSGWELCPWCREGVECWVCGDSGAIPKPRVRAADDEQEGDR
jgi:hypothetical protein